MRRIALIAALVAAAIAVPLSFGSSHREAPLTSIDPTADDTDLYAFTAKDAPGALTVVANWVPFEDPAGGPNFYKFDDRAHYYINIDNTGDGAPDIRYQFAFKTKVGNPNSFLYALPGVSSINDAKLNVKQTYTVTRYVYKNGKARSPKRIANGVPVAPNNVGPRTFPNYDAVANEAIKSLPGGGKVFAGQRDDPFFVDLGQTFDAINFRPNVGTGNQGNGKDDLAGYNVHSIVLQVPEGDVTRDGKSVSAPDSANAVIGVWASTERQAFTINSSGKGKGKWVQVSRLGNPLVNEVVIPLGLKDKYNRTQPKDDAKNYASNVLNPELAAVMNLLYKVNAPEHDRTDIVDALLVGLEGKTKISPNAVPADTLKLNLGVPPADTENHMGVLGGDLAGFPDGRRLADDVTDEALRVVAGELKGNHVPLGDGVDQNDVPFLGSFPYVAPPHNGYDSSLKRTEPGHDATP
jgi:hypothetical protein